MRSIVEYAICCAYPPGPSDTWAAGSIHEKGRRIAAAGEQQEIIWFQRPGVRRNEHGSLFHLMKKRSELGIIGEWRILGMVKKILGAYTNFNVL